MKAFLHLLCFFILFSSCNNGPAGNNSSKSKSILDEKEQTLSFTDSNQLIPEKYWGQYMVHVETEMTSSGMASITYNFNFEEKGVFLDMNTYHEPIRCEGKYFGVEDTKQNSLELFYKGDDEVCKFEGSRFQIKIKGKNLFAKGLGGEGTFKVWQKLKKASNNGLWSVQCSSGLTYISLNDNEGFMSLYSFNKIDIDIRLERKDNEAYYIYFRGVSELIKYYDEYLTIEENSIARDKPIAVLTLGKRKRAVLNWIGLFNNRTNQLEFTNECVFVRENSGVNPIELEFCD